jgi:hypothetical protein
MTDFNNAGSRSLVCWIAARSAGSSVNWIFRWQNESIDSGTFGLFIQAADLKARVRVGGTAFNAQLAFTPTFDTWYHAAAVYDATAQTIKLYLDGALVATTSVTNSGNIDAADGVDISSDSATVNSSSPGPWVVDSPEIYSRALTLAEVQAHMGGG